ncbi:MAG: hypothetical protein ACYTG2_11220 [Planctomycetota bacterium]|jgi:hypothetical protein
MRLLLASLLASAFVACSAGPTNSPIDRPSHAPWATAGSASSSFAWQEAAEESADDDGRGIGHRLLWYIPNRISDVLDIVRARVRIGPGVAVGVRATELADVYLGSYATVFVGVPGPRRERSFNWPFGFESLSGAEISVAEATVEGGIGPNYGLAEFGVSLQLLIVGIDVGVDPLEVVDLAVGLLTFDILGDDI